MRRGAVLALLCIELGSTLAACSGSSGEGPTGAGGGAGANTSGDYTIAPTSLLFEGRGGGLRPAPQTVQVTAHGIPLYLKTAISGAAVESVSIEVTGDQTAVVTVHPASPVDLPTGSSTASVSIEGCTDPVCSGHVNGSPKTVAITYTKSIGGLTGMPSSLAFTQTPAGPAPAAQSVSLRDLGDASSAWTSDISYQNGSGWLTITPASGTALPASAMIGVVPGTVTGTNHATVHFLVGTISIFPVDVTYTLSADFRAMPTTMNVVGAFGTPTPDQHLSLSDGLGESYPWTVSLELSNGEPSGWAAVSPTSGDSLPADVVVSLGAVPDRLSHFAALRVTAAGTERLIPLTYRTP